MGLTRFSCNKYTNTLTFSVDTLLIYIERINENKEYKFTNLLGLAGFGGGVSGASNTDSDE